MNETRERLRQYILSNHLPDESPETLRYDTPLLTSAILDSLAAQGLVAFIQQEFGIELDVYETSLERFDRIEEIAASIARKQALLAQPGSESVR
jgi:acyl carrier protein